MMRAMFLLFAIGPAQAADWPTSPDHSVTKGATVPGITVQTICGTKWGADARHVTAAMKRSVVAEYHFDVRACPLTLNNGKRVPRVEIDHLISRELGGADTVDNLWPQCYKIVQRDKAKQDDGAHKKDRLENKLHGLVCAAKPANRAALLAEYQRKIAGDWIALYHEIYGHH